MKKSKCSSTDICPFEYALDVISKKWRGLVIYYLYINGTMRFSYLRRELDGVTQKMLTQTLRFLEEEKIISRKVYPVVPPKVEYTLTDKGKSLMPILQSLQDWGKKHLEVSINE